MTNQKIDIDYATAEVIVEARFDELIASVKGLRKFIAEGVDATGKTTTEIFDELAITGKPHGFSTSTDPERISLWNCYQNIKARCNRAGHPRFKDYGGRGLKCEFETFEDFARHVGFRPSSRYSIDRIDNDDGYNADNVKWSTLVEQANNTRRNK